MQICSSCSGSGYVEYYDTRQEPCKRCKGNGQVPDVFTESTMRTDSTRQYPFYAILTENIYDGPGDSGKVPEGTILLVCSSNSPTGPGFGSGSYLVDLADDETNTQPRFWVLQSSVARLCDICEEVPATIEARYHHAMLCAGCFAIEAEMVVDEAAMLSEQEAPQDSESWREIKTPAEWRAFEKQCPGAASRMRPPWHLEEA